MRYNWSKSTLLKSIKELTILINNTSDISLKCFYKNTLDSLNNIYFNYFTDFENSKKLTSKDLLYDITNYFTSYGRYYSQLGEILKELLFLDKDFYRINSVIEKNETKTDFRVLTTKRLTHERTYSLVNDFYKQFDEYLYQLFLKQYNNRYKNTKFTTPFSNRTEELYQKSGDCLYIAGIDINLITVEENAAIIKYNDLIHECGHAIANFLNPKSTQNERLNVVSEVESIFPELISNYQDNNEFTILERRYMDFTKLNYYYYISKLLASHKPIVDLWQDYNFDDNKSFYKELKSEYNIDKSLLNEISRTYIDQDGSYIFSYVIALNLLHIYKDNPKEALNLYKYIINNQDKIDSLELLNTYSNINNSLKDEAKEIVNNLTLELNNKGIKI